MGICLRSKYEIFYSRGANNCGQCVLEKNIYFHFQLFYFNERKRINNADLFSKLSLIIFIKVTNYYDQNCT